MKLAVMASVLRSIVVSIGIALGSIVLSLALLEVGYRLLSGLTSSPPKWSDRPTVYFNPQDAKTMQGNVYDLEKPKGEYRIAVLGDSFAFATDMQFDDAFPARLERRLRASAPSAAQEAPTPKVINYGVPGYSTNHEVAEGRRAIKEGADFLLLQITLNDPQIKRYQPTGLTGNNQFGPYKPSPKWAPLVKHWHSLGFVLQRLHNTKTHDHYKNYYFDLYDRKDNWKNFSGSLQRLSKVAKRQKIPLVAVVFPLFGVPIDDQYPFTAIHQKIAKQLKELQIPTLDLLPAFQHIPLSRIQVVPGGDFHPNEIGHRIATEHIYEWLETLNTLPTEFFSAPRYRSRTDIRLLEENLWRQE